MLLGVNDLITLLSSQSVLLYAGLLQWSQHSLLLTCKVVQPDWEG